MILQKIENLFKINYNKLLDQKDEEIEEFKRQITNLNSKISNIEFQHQNNVTQIEYDFNQQINDLKIDRDFFK